MYDLVGHHDLRSSLSSHTGSYALLGPSGVGRRGIVAEWLQGRPAEVLGDLKRASIRSDIIYLVEGDSIRNWTPLLRPLEEGSFPVVIVARTLPAPVQTRLPTFRAGLLTEVEVTQVLARTFPMLQPRPILSRIAQGTLADIEFKEEVAKTFETLDHDLSTRHLPDFRKHRPMAYYGMVIWAAKASLGLPSLSFSPDAKSFFSRKTALQFLSHTPPAFDHEARNLLALMFSG